MSTPTLINLPPPPSNPDTPSDLGPGTPGSTTTSLSALSTTAIKDGHQGHGGHVPSHGHQHSTSSGSSTNTLDAERADRISRLAGLERVATVRGQAGTAHLIPGAIPGPPPGYFDGGQGQVKERSTVGSASATGSVGGRTTWASSSDVNDADKMSEDQDDGVSSMGGFSDEGNASLVGFGEGASTTDGPVSTSTVGRIPGRQSGVASPIVANPGPTKPGPTPPYGGAHGLAGHRPSSSNPFISASTGGSGSVPGDGRRIDGMTYDANVLDTVDRAPPPIHGIPDVIPSTDSADAMIEERFEPGEQTRPPPSAESEGQRHQGQYYAE
ncbi:MAG: hypothetical protein M1838_003803 [Thelocarpon superellum]|nr:MAG: hypothetical protein M1838_003803 [Thelocarpon superellum]